MMELLRHELELAPLFWACPSILGVEGEKMTFSAVS
jgi:hypothetical protein